MASQQHSSNGQDHNGPVPNGGPGTSSADATAAIPNQPPLSDFLLQLEEYTPTIPDAVVKHYLATSGFDSSDPRVLRLVSLAAQKFVSDVANDALQHCKMRNAGQAVKNNKNKGKWVKHSQRNEKKLFMKSYSFLCTELIFCEFNTILGWIINS